MSYNRKYIFPIGICYFLTGTELLSPSEIFVVTGVVCSNETTLGVLLDEGLSLGR